MSLKEHKFVSEDELMIDQDSRGSVLSYHFSASNELPKEFYKFAYDLFSDEDDGEEGELFLRIETPLRNILNNAVGYRSLIHPEEYGYKPGDVVMEKCHKDHFDTIREDLVHLLGLIDQIKYVNLR